jgi:2-phosphosulfolactate phosphatase
LVTVNTPDELKKDEYFDLAIVIDTLRTTTTVLTALESGAAGVILGQSQTADRSGWLLGGEKDGHKPAGFDLSNSPREMVRPWDGRGLVLQTTNGTQAFTVCAQVAVRVYAACLRNRGAVARLLPLSGRVLLGCAGDHGLTSLEDILTAGAIAESVAQRAAADDLTQVALLAWQHAWRQAQENKQGLVAPVLAGSRNARRLAASGLVEDVEFALDVDASRSVPVLIDSALRLHSGSVS